MAISMFPWYLFQLACFQLERSFFVVMAFLFWNLEVHSFMSWPNICSQYWDRERLFLQATQEIHNMPFGNGRKHHFEKTTGPIGMLWRLDIARWCQAAAGLFSGIFNNSNHIRSWDVFSLKGATQCWVHSCGDYLSNQKRFGDPSVRTRASPHTT